jgi:sulfate adenylyltransferase subunit 2
MNNSANLDALESRSVYLIREAYHLYKERLALLWSMGKDSTTLVHLVRKAFLGKIPVPVIHLDTSFKFREIYEFRERLSAQWGLKLIVARNDAALRKNMSPEKGRFECCNALKTAALQQVLKTHGFQALLLAIRRDEHSIRAKERYFSPRSESFTWDYQHQPLELWQEYFTAKAEDGRHFRVHPMLHWREIDVWEYIRRESLPVVGLYYAKGGQRFRSIGCACCCRPVQSSARTLRAIVKELETTVIAERSGRAQDKEKEYTMQKLRALGYM